ncbi:MAG: flagellar protein FlaG [Bryobacteraceae bacterium]
MKIDSFLSSAGAVMASVRAPAAEQRPGHHDLIEAVKAVNSSQMLGGQEIIFSLDRWTQRPVMTVVDRETQEVVRQFPDEKVLRMAAALKAGDGFKPHDKGDDE